MNVQVNKETCIGCGSCAAIAGEVFQMVDGKAEVVAGDLTGKEEMANQAKDACPVACITVE